MDYSLPLLCTPSTLELVLQVLDGHNVNIASICGNILTKQTTLLASLTIEESYLLEPKVETGNRYLNKAVMHVV